MTSNFTVVADASTSAPPLTGESFVNPFEDGTFKPGDNITRAHLAIMLNNYAAQMGMSLPVLTAYQGFVDDADIRNYAREAVERFFQAMIIAGRPDGRFDPQGNATRAELAAMLQRFILATETMGED